MNVEHLLDSTSHKDHSSYECARAWLALRELHASVAEALTAALANECGLAPNDFDVLVRLESVSPGSLRVGDLGDAVSLSQSAISRLVTRLEQQGLVRRIESHDDRRSALIELTDRGRMTLERAAEVHAKCIREHLIARLTDDEQEMLLTLFARLQDGTKPT